MQPCEQSCCLQDCYQTACTGGASRQRGAASGLMRRGHASRPHRLRLVWSDAPWPCFPSTQTSPRLV
eukprot:365034-Chlamydomonas_euryale.AAC.10